MTIDRSEPRRLIALLYERISCIEQGKPLHVTNNVGIKDLSENGVVILMAQSPYVIWIWLLGSHHPFTAVPSTT